MPASVIAVALLLVLFVPGYLFQAGVREHNSVLTAERDLYAIAQAVAISAGFLIFLSLLLALGEVVFSGDGLRAGLLHDPTTKDHEGLTNAQAVLLLFLLVFPFPLGRFFGRTKTNREKKKEEQVEGAPGAKQSSPKSPSPIARAWGWLWGFFFDPSPMATEVDRIARRAADEPIYVRIVSQGGEDIIGLMDPEAAEATRSKLGQGLSLSARWTPGDDGAAWRQLPGTHIGTAQIVHIFCWGQQAGTPPVWLERVPGVSGAVDGGERAGGLRERLGL
jgi:Family of unknown function (DUF6338)